RYAEKPNAPAPRTTSTRPSRRFPHSPGRRPASDTPSRNPYPATPHAGTGTPRTTAHGDACTVSQLPVPHTSVPTTPSLCSRRYVEMKTPTRDRSAIVIRLTGGDDALLSSALTSIGATELKRRPPGGWPRSPRRSR